MFVVVKSEPDPLALVPAIQERIWSLNPVQPIQRVTSMDALLRRSLAPQEFLADVTGGFSILALILAAVGIYGVFSFLATSRNRELAIRVALGSTPRNLVRLILRQGVWPVVVGISIGLSGAFAARRVAGTLLYGVTATDPASLLIVVLLLCSVSLFAILLPAWRASRVDPMLALRQE